MFSRAGNGTSAWERSRAGSGAAWAAAIVMFVIAAAGFAFAFQAHMSTRYVPYVIAVDDLNRRVLAPAPRSVSEWEPALLRREVAAFVGHLRAVTPDRAMLHERVQSVYAHIRKRSTAYGKIDAFYRDERFEPFARARDVTVTVDVESVTRQGGATWGAEWTEIVYGRVDGKEQDRRRYRATVILTTDTNISQDALRLNPMGVFVEDIDIQEVRS